jgi:putative SOS response-associated peptidase YedK
MSAICPLCPACFPIIPAPLIRDAGDAEELVLMRWGMLSPPRIGGPPVTNIRNTSSRHLSRALPNRV